MNAIIYKVGRILPTVASALSKNTLACSIPAMQLLPTNNQHVIRAMSMNPRTERDDREAEEALRRMTLMLGTQCRSLNGIRGSGLKVEWADCVATIMDRASSRLRDSACQRREMAAKDLPEEMHKRATRHDRK